MHQRRSSTVLIAALLAVLSAGSASAQLNCGIDRNGDGDVADFGETASCFDENVCPIDQVACVSAPAQYVCPEPGELQNSCTQGGGVCSYGDAASPSGERTSACVPDPVPAFECPLNPGRPCAPAPDGVHYCSLTSCVDAAAVGGAEDLSRPRERLVDDGAVSADGECLDQFLIFNGTALDCRPPGAQTLFKNCCKDQGRVILDGAGAAGTAAIGFQAVGAVFTGMKAAHSAYSSGASSTQAASAGTTALLGGFDPTSLAASLAITLMIDLLNLGCDQQDMETATLRSSGMCAYVGDYCSVSLPLVGCIQKSRAHCCFNSVLGRIIHEQGRAQLASFGAGWGDAETPDCRGFSPDEFQALDFSQMDLSEYYGALSTRAATDMQVIMEGGASEYVDANNVQ